MEYFVSSEGTQYNWSKSHECVVDLTKNEIALLKVRVLQMSDKELLNKQSGNGTIMGLPVRLSRERLLEIRGKLVDVLKQGPFINFEEHAISRIVEDSLLEDSDPEKRGWTSIAEAKDCVLSAKSISGVRLNIDHNHPENTESVKHLHQHIALEIRGEKSNGIGRLVLVLLSQNTISVITVL